MIAGKERTDSHVSDLVECGGKLAENNQFVGCIIASLSWFPEWFPPGWHELVVYHLQGGLTIFCQVPLKDLSQKVYLPRRVLTPFIQRGWALLWVLQVAAGVDKSTSDFQIKVLKRRILRGEGTDMHLDLPIVVPFCGGCLR